MSSGVFLQLLRTKISTGETLSEDRGRSLSSANWFCKEAKYCAFSHSDKCWPTAQQTDRKASLCHADICFDTTWASNLIYNITVR